MGVKGVDEMSQDEYRKATIEAVKKLSVDVGIPTKLEVIKEEDLQFLAESGTCRRMRNRETRKMQA